MYELDVAWFARRILRPERLSLPQARAAIEGLNNPHEAWEALASRGFFPMEQLAVPHRTFRRRGDATRSIPPTPKDCATIAGDFAAFSTAEALANEFVTALEALEIEVPLQFHWVVDWPRAKVVDAEVHPALRALSFLLSELVPREARNSVLRRSWRVLEDTGFPHKFPVNVNEVLAEYLDWFASPAETHLFSAFLWSWLEENNVSFPVSSRAWSIPSAYKGQSLQKLRNPFAPLVGIWSTGYAVECISHTGIEMVCPRVRVKKRR